MSGEDLKANLHELFGEDGAPPPESRFEIVTVPIDDDEMETITEDPDNLPRIVKDILNAHIKDIQHLHWHFIEDDSRLTLDDGSFDVQCVNLNPQDAGSAECVFTVSAYYGCKDQDTTGDERECSLPLEVDLEARRITLKVRKIDRRDTVDEF